MGRVSKQRRHIQRLADATRRLPPANDDAEAVVQSVETVSLSTIANIDLAADVTVSDDNDLDGWVHKISDNQLEEISAQCWLQWKQGAGSQLRKAQNGTGRSTFFAKQAEKKRMVESMSGCKNILHYFASDRPPVEDSVLEEGDLSLEPSIPDQDVPEKSIGAAIEKLKAIVQIKNNARLEKRRGLSQFDFIRHLCVLNYLEKLQLNPRSRIKSSIEVAAIVFGKGDGKRSHKSNSIITWSDEFVRSHELMTLRQGKHQKIESLIDDSDVRFACLSYLRKARPETISGHSFAQWVTENLYKHPELSLDHPVNIHRNTAIQWLHNLGFRKLQHKKGTYTDGHERPDVVAYRTT